MGSHASRRMTDTDPFDSHQEPDEPDLPTVLAYLLRSGQIRLFSSEELSSSEDSSSDRELCGGSLPVVDPKPDTSLLEQNDLSREIKTASGRIVPTSKRKWAKRATIPHMVFERSLGGSKRQPFTVGDQSVLNSKYLPNHMTRLEKYNHKVFCGTYSMDGNIFLVATQDQCIRVYDTQKDFGLFKTIKARDVGWSILDTAFSPDGNYLIYSSWSDCIHLCNIFGDFDVHEPLYLHPENHSFCIFSLTFSSDNREILGGANDGFLYIYDREQHTRTMKINAHDDDVNTVAFADDSSNILLSGADDGLCKVWDRRMLREGNPEPVGTMAGHRDGITYISSKMDGRYFISNCKDQTIKLWDMRKFSGNDIVENTKRQVSMRRWDYRWEQVPKRVMDTSVLPGDSSLMTYRGHCVLHTLLRCRFSPYFTTGQRYIYTGCASGCVIIYDLLTGKMVKKLRGHMGCVRDISWHPHENTIISSSWDCSLGRWDYLSIEGKAEGPEEEEYRYRDHFGIISSRSRNRKNRDEEEEEMHRNFCRLLD